MKNLVFILLVLISFSSHLLADGKSLYQQYCASCHHVEKIGFSGPPLLEDSLKSYRDEDLKNIIKNGIPATSMPSFSQLNEEEIGEIIAFLREKSNYNYTINDIKTSYQKNSEKFKELRIKNIKDLTFVVERGRNLVWLMENTDIIDKFEFRNVHGGIKYTLDGKNFFIPSRDGWIGKYIIDKKEGKYFGKFDEKIRPCIYLRNIAISRDNKYLIAACILPKKIYIFNIKDLSLQKEIPLEDDISAIYELNKKDEAVFTLKNKAVIGFLSTKNFKISYKNIDEPFDDFFIDPFEKFIIGTSRKENALEVYDIENSKLVFKQNITGMPHLFSATFWYKNGHFYFATPHINKGIITIWEMYNWKLLKTINIEGNGFFVKTHPNSEYLWADNGTDNLILISKDDYSIKKLTPIKGKKFIHTEFNSNGKYAYLSIADKDGALIIYDTYSLEEIKRYDANFPIGKYNFVNKSRYFYPAMLGEEIFKEKCWGCHHQTEEAFGPSFKYIAKKRKKEEIYAQILHPEVYYKILGYKRNAMPSFNLNIYELDAITEYIKSFEGEK